MSSLVINAVDNETDSHHTSVPDLQSDVETDGNEIADTFNDATERADSNNMNITEQEDRDYESPFNETSDEVDI